ncbi:MAG: signal peptidase II [Desulfovibrio sp.]|nr:signal peptidase II [Desulfovibrio sp.]
MKNKYVVLLLTALGVLGLDQLTKLIVRSTIEPGEVIVVIPGFFDLVNIRNRGAAFGFLNRPDIEWQFWLFLGATLLASVVIFVIAKSAKRQPALIIGLGMILGGAIGNLIDRVHFRSVVDFLDFYWRGWHWPAFNVADMGICAGAFLACVAAWKRETEDEK